MVIESWQWATLKATVLAEIFNSHSVAIKCLTGV